MEINKNAIKALTKYNWPGNYSEIVDLFRDVCPVIADCGENHLSVGLLKKSRQGFSPSTQEILARIC